MKLSKLFFMLIALFISVALPTMLTSCSSDDDSEKDDDVSNFDETFFLGYWVCNQEEVFDFQPNGRLVWYELETKGDNSVYSTKETGYWGYDAATSQLYCSISNKSVELNVNINPYMDNRFTTDTDGEVWIWNKIYKLPEEAEDSEPQFRESDFIGYWVSGNYLFNFGHSNNLRVYHLSDIENNMYDDESDGRWSFNPSNNELEVSFKENEFGTTIEDSWEVISVTNNQFVTRSAEWTRTDLPSKDYSKNLVGTWVGKYDNDDVSIEITFQSNKTFTMKEVVDGERINTRGSWTYSSGKILFKYNGDESILANTCGDVVSIYDISATTLIIFGGGETVTLSKR